MDTVKGILLALLTGVVLLISFPYPDIGFLTFFGLVPLLLAVRHTSLKKAALYGLISGLVFFGGLSYWVAIYGLVPFFLITTVMALFLVVFSSATQYVSKRTSFIFEVFFIPSLWVSLEFIRSELGSFSFPYGVLGYSQHDFLALLQLASIVGVYGISFLIVLTNVLIVGIIDNRRDSGFQIKVAVSLIIILIASFCLGFGLLKQTHKERQQESVLVGLVQVSIPQSLDRDESENPQIMRKYERAIFDLRDKKPELLALPESTLPSYVPEDDPLIEQMRQWARNMQTPLLIGIPLISQNGRSFNTAQLIDKEGKTQDMYKKIHPTPFGEFIPIRSVSEKLWTDFTTRGDISGGDSLTIFKLSDVDDRLESGRFSVLLCSESLYSHLGRQMVQEGADVLFVLTNDAWFKRTSEAEQHFVLSKMRAVENGCFVVQVANSGISGFVTSKGEVLKRTQLFEVEALVERVVFSRTATFYTRVGFLFPYALIIGDLFFFLYLIISKSSADKSTKE